MSKRRCAHLGCAAWASAGSELCNEHGGQLAVGLWPRPGCAGQAPTLDGEIARLAAQRDRVEHWLELMMADGACEAAEVRRSLAALSQVGRSLAMMMAKRAEQSGPSDLESFLAMVARQVREGVENG